MFVGSRSSLLRNAACAFCAIAAAFILGPAARAQQPHIISFDVPASNGNGTVPIGVNLEGTLTGFYFDASGIGHGFLRSADGKITTFDAPGAGTNPNNFGGTFPVGINLQGSVAGFINRFRCLKFS